MRWRLYRPFLGSPWTLAATMGLTQQSTLGALLQAPSLAQLDMLRCNAGGQPFRCSPERITYKAWRAPVNLAAHILCAASPVALCFQCTALWSVTSPTSDLSCPSLFNGPSQRGCLGSSCLVRGHRTTRGHGMMGSPRPSPNARSELRIWLANITSCDADNACFEG